MVVLRFCKGAVELRGSFSEVVFLLVERFFGALRVYGSTVSFRCSVRFSGGSEKSWREQFWAFFLRQKGNVYVNKIGRSEIFQRGGISFCNTVWFEGITGGVQDFGEELRYWAAER